MRPLALVCSQCPGKVRVERKAGEMRARAVVFVARDEVAFQEIEVPQPQPTDVVVRVHYSWISPGTEGSFLRCERIGGETPFRPGDPLPFPLVAGYQKTGIIEWVGSEVEGLAVGEWVFASVSHVQGMFHSMGGHVSPAVTPADQVWKLPAGLSPVEASGLILTQVGYNCGTRAPVAQGEVAVVLGDGLVGQWSAQTLAWRGATVAMVGRHDFRLGRFRAAHSMTLNARQVDPVPRVQALAPAGVAVVVDTVGSIPAVEAFLPLMKHDGHIVSAGFYGEKGHMDIQKLRPRETSLHSPSGWTRSRVDATLALLAEGHLDAASLITHRFAVSKAREAWDTLVHGHDEALGVILEWE